MSSIYYPARGFFIGKASKYLKALAIVGLLAYPAVIQADTITTSSQAAVSNVPTAIASTAKAVSPLTSAITAAIPANTKTELAWITAYTSAPEETSDHPLITASGNMVRDGIVADNLLPFGTQIEIPALFGNKVFTVEDRTNQKFSGRVDIWMPSVHQAVNFGIQHVQIVILDSNLALK
jgi:3D (Asp-Asp-Asp) domain-containing protein